MSYSFYWPISKPVEETENLLKWLKQKSPSHMFIRTIHVKNDWHYHFVFRDEKDYVLTVLRWK